jgi:RNA polymerase-binding protein DksA
MTLDSQIISELKEKMVSEKKQLEEELNRIATPSTANGDYNTKFSEMGTDEDDNASEVEEYTDNLAIEANLEKQLKEINEALEKIEAGNYGKCENCNEDISIERLRAYPAAKTCIKC